MSRPNVRPREVSVTPRSALLVSSPLLGAAICAQAQTAPAVRSDVHHVQFTKADPGSRGDGWAVVRQYSTCHHDTLADRIAPK